LPQRRAIRSYALRTVARTELGFVRKAHFATYLTKYTVLPVSREICVQWAKVTFGARQLGRPIQTADAWIAASALHYQVPLITNNGSDYAMIDGLSVLST
jgi:predicted nucleic acid-binding protein